MATEAKNTPAVLDAIPQESDTDRKYRELQTIGRNAFEAIAEMVERVAAAETLTSDPDDAEAFRKLRRLDSEIRDEFRGALTDAFATRIEDGDTRREAWDAARGVLDFDTAAENARQAIQEDPLSLEYRSGWYAPGEHDDQGPEEFKVLLSTGGPATRIIGEFGSRGSISRCRLQAQDWFTAWTDYFEPGISSVLERYCDILGVGCEL